MLHSQPIVDPWLSDEDVGDTAKDWSTPKMSETAAGALALETEFTDHERRLTLLLATWFALWEILENHAVVVGPPGMQLKVDHRSGIPFTRSAVDVVDPRQPQQTDGLQLNPKGLGPSQTALLRRAAALWGGHYLTREGRLTGCWLGLNQEETRST